MRKIYKSAFIMKNMKKKVCFFATNYDFTRQNLVDYYERFLGKEADLYLFSNETDIAKYKTKYMKKFGYKGGKLNVAPELRKFCRKNNIDIAVSFSGGGEVSIMLLLATIFTKTEYIAQTHGNFFWKWKDMRKLGFTKHALQYDMKNSLFLISQFFFKRMLICAPDIKKKLERYFFLNKGKLRYLPSAINTELYRVKDKNKARKKYGFKKNEKVIIFVGRVSYLKGSDFLMELVKKNPDKKFVLLGSITDENFKRNVPKNILLAKAFGEDLVDYYNAADLGIFLSRTEGNPFAVRECMASEKPVMVLDIESLRLYGPAIKVSADIKEMQSELEKFFKMSKNDKEKLEKESRKFVVDNYSFKALKKEYVKSFLF